MSHSDEASARWADMLERLAIPADLVAAAPTPPYFFDAAVFADAAAAAMARGQLTPSGLAAGEALEPGGVVLDVGVGAGAASLPLRAGRVIGVDVNQELLDLFVERAARYAIAATPILGRWPDVASDAPVADVVVCHHVVYNVADLASFALALSSHAHRRVVVELTADYPLAWLAPYWSELHGWTQPAGPTADDATAVLASLGLTVHQNRWRGEAQMMGESGPDRIARLARRLCLPADRHDELIHLIDQYPPPRERELVTLSWDVPSTAKRRNARA